MPAAATKRTAAGAEAFARFYTEAMQSSMISGESKVIRTLSLDTCKACTRLAAVIDTRAAKGQHQKRPTFTFGPSQMSSAATESTPVVDILVEDSGVEIVNGAGATVSKSAAARLNFRHTLEWNSGWRVAKSVLVK